MLPRLKAPAMERTVAISKAAAASTNNPTHACSPREFILDAPVSALPAYSGGNKTFRRLSRRLPSQKFRRAHFLPIFGQHLQVIEFVFHFRLRHAVQELAYARVVAGGKFLFGAGHDEIPPVDQQHAVCDQE